MEDDTSASCAVKVSIVAVTGYFACPEEIVGSFSLRSLISPPIPLSFLHLRPCSVGNYMLSLLCCQSINIKNTLYQVGRVQRSAKEGHVCDRMYHGGKFLCKNPSF